MYSLLDAAGGDPKDPVLLNAVGQIGMAMRTGYIDLVEHSDGEIGIRLTEKGRATDSNELVELMRCEDNKQGELP